MKYLDTLIQKKESGRQFVNVDIAEEHAVALASGIATNGGNPVCGMNDVTHLGLYDIGMMSNIPY